MFSSVQLKRAEWHVKKILKFNLTREILCRKHEEMPDGFRYWFDLSGGSTIIVHIKPKNEIHFWFNGRFLAILPIRDISGIDYYDQQKLRANFC